MLQEKLRFYAKVVKQREKNREYFENFETSKNFKPFWNKCKPYFSNKHAYGES